MLLLGWGIILMANERESNRLWSVVAVALAGFVAESAINVKKGSLCSCRGSPIVIAAYVQICTNEVRHFVMAWTDSLSFLGLTSCETTSSTYFSTNFPFLSQNPARRCARFCTNFWLFSKTEQLCQRSIHVLFPPGLYLSPEFFVCLRVKRASCNKTTVVTVVLTW